MARRLECRGNAAFRLPRIARPGDDPHARLATMRGKPPCPDGAAAQRRRRRADESERSNRCAPPGNKREPPRRAPRFRMHPRADNAHPPEPSERLVLLQTNLHYGRAPLRKGALRGMKPSLNAAANSFRSFTGVIVHRFTISVNKKRKAESRDTKPDLEPRSQPRHHARAPRHVRNEAIGRSSYTAAGIPYRPRSSAASCAKHTPPRPASRTWP